MLYILWHYCMQAAHVSTLWNMRAAFPSWIFFWLCRRPWHAMTNWLIAMRFASNRLTCQACHVSARSVSSAPDTVERENKWKKGKHGQRFLQDEEDGGCWPFKVQSCSDARDTIYYNLVGVCATQSQTHKPNPSSCPIESFWILLATVQVQRDVTSFLDTFWIHLNMLPARPALALEPGAWHNDRTRFDWRDAMNIWWTSIHINQLPIITNPRNSSPRFH